MREMYFSVDVEANGPVPGIYSMLSIGVVALHPDTLAEVGHFYRRLKQLPGAMEDPATMSWWTRFPDQYIEATSEQRDQGEVMRDLERWLQRGVESFLDDDGTPPKPIFVAYPATFDFSFYSYYAHRFVGSAVLGFSGLDMSSLAMGLRGGCYDEQVRRNWPAAWVTEQERNEAAHHALLDARQQANIFRRMMSDRPPRGT